MHFYMHPFHLLPDLGKLITINRLSLGKHKIKTSVNLENIAFYRYYLHFIEYIKHKRLIIKIKRNE
jgi:hypothetical protein